MRWLKHKGKTMTDTTISIRHADTEITAIFARLMQEQLGGKVAILPNVSVLNSARRQSRRPGSVEMSVLANDDLWTCYSVGRDVLLIDGYTGKGTRLTCMTWQKMKTSGRRSPPRIRP